MAEKLKIISLGGLNEIGKNLTVYEYGGDIIVVDELTLSEGKTKLMANVLKKLALKRRRWSCCRKRTRTWFAPRRTCRRQ